ncbi:hypothetical protein HAX54_031361 [Datura stramonium]|uniref:Uncharacterized protein n=1 Tax=Datura stramonium TaxID=4076 RepID=A0ABS8VC96_DATST|nr:hypothetical protein [Datura stramonium]
MSPSPNPRSKLLNGMLFEGSSRRKASSLFPRRQSDFDPNIDGATDLATMVPGQVLSSGYRPSDYSSSHRPATIPLRPSDFSRWGSSDDDYGPGDSACCFVFTSNYLAWGSLIHRIALSTVLPKHLLRCKTGALLENDQLRIEQRRGRVFVGWKEGKIYFYDISNIRGIQIGVIEYCGMEVRSSKAIISYIHESLDFPDHRPVSSVFWAEVESNSASLKEMEDAKPPAFEYAPISIRHIFIS